MALVDTTGLFASCGKAAGFTVLKRRQYKSRLQDESLGIKEKKKYLVHRLDNPVDARITADCFVLRIDKDNLVVLVS